jgi:hypothetical protein
MLIGFPRSQAKSTAARDKNVASSRIRIQVRHHVVSHLIDYDAIAPRLTYSGPARLALEKPRQVPDRRPEIAHLDILSNPLGQLVGYPRGCIPGVHKEDRCVVILMTDGSSC